MLEGMMLRLVNLLDRSKLLGHSAKNSTNVLAYVNSASNQD